MPQPDQSQEPIEQRYTALRNALMGQDFVLAEQLFQRSATAGEDLVNFVNHGTAPAFRAMLLDFKSERRREAFEFLLSHGAKIVNDADDPEIFTDRCVGVAAIAAADDNLELLQYLVDRFGRDQLEAADDRGHKAIHHAAIERSWETMHFLLELDSNSVFHADKKGLLPIDLAAKHSPVGSKDSEIFCDRLRTWQGAVEARRAIAELELTHAPPAP